MKLLKQVYRYLNYRNEINQYYSYAIKEGYCGDETYNWK
jgi:hypothetical protein